MGCYFKKHWNSLEDMVLHELLRLDTFFNDQGVELDENVPKIPY